MLAFFKRGVQAALFAMLAFGLAPGLAQADAAGDTGVQASVSCTAGRLCFYKDTNFNGLARRFTVNENDYHTVNWWDFGTNQETSDEMDNDTSSVINKTGGWVRLYQDVGYGGRGGFLGHQRLGAPPGGFSLFSPFYPNSGNTHPPPPTRPPRVCVFPVRTR